VCITGDTYTEERQRAQSQQRLRQRSTGTDSYRPTYADTTADQSFRAHTPSPPAVFQQDLEPREQAGETARPSPDAEESVIGCDTHTAERQRAQSQQRLRQRSTGTYSYRPTYANTTADGQVDNTSRRMSEVEILRAAIKIFTVMADWKDDHLLRSGEARRTRARYEAFLLWLLGGIGRDPATALLLSRDGDNEGWDAVQLELTTFLGGGGQYEEVGGLLAAGAKQITKLRRYLQQTEVTQVKLPSVSVTLQSLKPLCRLKWEMRPGRGSTVQWEFCNVQSIAFGRQFISQRFKEGLRSLRVFVPHWRTSSKRAQLSPGTGARFPSQRKHRRWWFWFCFCRLKSR
jgi:hypothetical protein